MKLLPYLKLGNVEIANSLRALTYLRRGLAGGGFDVALCARVAEGSGYSDVYCLTPEQRLLTADLRWVPCGSVEVGDELLAFEEYPQPGNRLRRWKPSTVTHSRPAEKECVRVHLSNGDTVECSADHPWLVSAGNRKGTGMRWEKAARLATGQQVQRVTETWTPDVSFDGGWLSGMFDGEGCLIVHSNDRTPTIRLEMAQKPGPVMDRVCDLLDARKFRYLLSPPTATSSAAYVSIRGGQSEVLRALGTLRPMRLLENWRKSAFMERTTRAPDGPGITVSAVEWLGDREVQSIATTTGTYVGEGYLMHNSDIYEPDPFEAENLLCYCSAMDTGPYQDPAYDAAPWYSASRPESADFLGLDVEVRLQPILSRTLTRRSAGGGDIGPIIAKPRIIEVTGQMFAASECGMEYGERWLSIALMGTQEGCGNDTLTVLPCCNDEEESGGLRDLANVGLVDGPLFSHIVRNETTMQQVAFQFAAGEPYLRTTSVGAAGVNLASTATTCVTLDATVPVLAQSASVITISAGASVLDAVDINLYAGACPGSGPSLAFATILNLPANATIVIDSSKRSVVVTNAAGTVIGAFDYLDFTGIFEWFTAVTGQTRSVVVTTAGATGTTGATLDIDVIELEA